MSKKLFIFRKIILGAISEYVVIIYEKVAKLLDFLNIQSQFRKLLIKFNFPRLERIKTYQFYSQFIKKGELCFDIGANIGKITNILLNIGAKVICVEPQKSCLIKLHKFYNKTKNVIIVNKALGAKVGFGKLHICDETDTMSTLSEDFRTKSRYSKDYSWRKKTKVAITTLDNLIHIYGIPKFCKVDVEGYEVEVFRGLSKKIPYICFEFHMELIGRVKSCLDQLLSLGSIKVNFTKGDKKELCLKKWVSPNNLYKILESLKNNSLWGDIYTEFI
ncbi:MAG: FkbM family methyltransferase [Promethearchaeota archaeon]